MNIIIEKNNLKSHGIQWFVLIIGVRKITKSVMEKARVYRVLNPIIHDVVKDNQSILCFDNAMENDSSFPQNCFNLLDLFPLFL